MVRRGITWSFQKNMLKHKNSKMKLKREKIQNKKNLEKITIQKHKSLAHFTLIINISLYIFPLYSL